jgi:hypothetical protein
MLYCSVEILASGTKVNSPGSDLLTGTLAATVGPPRRQARTVLILQTVVGVLGPLLCVRRRRQQNADEGPVCKVC